MNSKSSIRTWPAILALSVGMLTHGGCVESGDPVLDRGASALSATRFKLRNPSTGLCVRRSTSQVVGSGYEVYQASCSDTAAQLWWRDDCDGADCKFVSGDGAGYCLKASSSLTASGGSYNIYAVTCSSDVDQRWTVADLGSSQLRLQNRDTSRCAHATESETTSQGQPQLVQRACDNSNTKQRFVKVPEVATVDATTLTGKVMAGYQGWFATSCDGSGRGWRHWAPAKPTASNVTFDLWPDLREYAASELCPTNLVYGNGSEAGLFSAYNTSTVERHVKWMKTYGIDGVFVQRFLTSVTSSPAFRDRVLENVRTAAESQGRVFVNMYDISGASSSTMVADLKRDWMHLVDDVRITESPRYLRHKGRPLLAIWGFGVSDRPGTPSQVAELINWLTETAPSKYRVTLMGGVDDDWRSHSTAWLNVYKTFDVISPWSVGRYDNDAGADNFRDDKLEPDLAYCDARDIDYLPVIFPGFSWYNLKDGASPLNKIPRRGGRFFWRQAYNAVSAGADMVYVAMFDEVDEGTAMFKIAENSGQTPTTGSWVKLNADGITLPSDWYLRLMGEASKMLRGEIPVTSTIPITP